MRERSEPAPASAPKTLISLTVYRDMWSRGLGRRERWSQVKHFDVADGFFGAALANQLLSN